MPEQGAIEPMTFRQYEGLFADEKRRVIFQGLIPPPIAGRYIRQVESEEERWLIRAALESVNV